MINDLIFSVLVGDIYGDEAYTEYTEWRHKDMPECCRENCKLSFVTKSVAMGVDRCGGVVDEGVQAEAYNNA